MRIVITGAAGFLGSRLAAAILERGTLTDTRGELRSVTELVLVDLVRPTLRDRRVVALEGSL
ncbi:MAG TPA: NAD-dependent epimerase, partial [Casimicrobiaceae bacterium]|nr:NAD-dependent epimerase [Casimicrobiaceae bacterium]